MVEIARRSWIALGATVVLIAAALAFLAQPRDRPAAAPVDPAAAAEVPAEPGATVQAEHAPSAPERRAAQPASTRSLQVLVLDGGGPVPDAQVQAVASAELSRALAAAGARLHDPAGRRLHRSLAIGATTDAQGIATLQVPDAALTLEGSRGGRWGFASLPRIPDDGRALLELAADRSLRVQVVDGLGRRCDDVPVVLRRRTGIEAGSAWSHQETLSEAPDGIATFLHVQRRWQQGRGWQVAFGFPLPSPPILAVDEGTAGEPPLRLQLPDTGGLRVSVRNAKGEVPDLTGAELHLSRAGIASGVLEPGRWSRPALDRATGTALLPRLGLGIDLGVELRVSDVVVASGTAAGPRLPGEIAQHQLDWNGFVHHVARGRFVRNDGSPWPECEATAQVVLRPAPDFSPLAQKLQIGSDGHFALDVRHARPANGSRRYTILANHPEEGSRVTAYLPLDQEIPAGGIELGDVRLDHGPLLVAGRVVDPSGRPVEGVLLHLNAFTSVMGSPMWRWVSTSGAMATGDDGRFALHLAHGESDPGPRLRLRVEAKSGELSMSDGEREPGTIECVRGATDVVIVLQPTGGIAGSVELGGGLEPRDLLVTLVGPSGDRKPKRHPLAVQRDGSFEWSRLTVGSYTLEVRIRDTGGDRRPQIVVPDLLAFADRVDRDPRIQRLHLDNPFTTIRLRVVDRSSAPLRALATIAGIPNARPVHADASGTCRLHLAKPPVDVEVTAFGYRSRLIQGLARDHEVVLDDGIPVQFVSGARPVGRDPRYQLGLILYDVDEAGLRRGPTYADAYPTEQRFFDAAGNLSLRLPRAGTYQCDVLLHVELDDHVGRGGSVALPAPLRITVADLQQPQRFELAIPQAAVDATVARLAR